MSLQKYRVVLEGIKEVFLSEPCYELRPYVPI